MNMLRLSLCATLLMSLMAVPFSQTAIADDERTAGTQPRANNDYSDTYKQLNLFGDVFERVRAQYVEDVTDKELIEHAINGMLTSLDPHSSYLNEDDFAEMQVKTKGEFGGLGIEVTMENGFVKVVSPIDETPAYRAGMKAGDYITHIDGEEVLGMSLSDAVDRMRGKVGTDIALTVRREGVADALEITITRDIIRIRSVRSRVEGNAGYIRITTFNQNTAEGVENAIEEIKDQLGNKLIGYVLDLRNNPGGLLDQAIMVSDLFLERGEIVSTRGREERDTKRDNATPGDIADGLPIVVLINGGSASASEIVSGALQDHKRAILLGEKSYGKGSVQTVIPLPGNGAMRLTTARYYTPSGRSIQAKGIEPDIKVTLVTIENIEHDSRREADLRGALSNPQNAANDNNKTEELKKDTTAEEEAEQMEELRDYQLVRALDLLSGLNLYKGSMDGFVSIEQDNDEQNEAAEDAKQ